MTTIFLATVMGWYMVVMSLILFFKQNYLKLVVADIMTEKGLFFIVAIMTFILGLLLVVSHNIWMMGWPVLVTILSWLVLLGGLIRLFFPETVQRIWENAFNNSLLMRVIGVIILILGVYLLLHVYYFRF